MEKASFTENLKENRLCHLPPSERSERWSMKKLLLPSLVLFAASVVAPAFGATTNIAGQWKVHNSIAGNESDQDCTFAVAEKKITGSCKSQDRTVDVTGNIDGNKVSWKYEVDFNGSTLTLVYTATLGETEKVAGEVEVQPMGIKGDFSASPAKPAK